MRLDLFLKQTALIKRRTIAKELADKGRVFINNKLAKPSSEVRGGDVLKLILGSRIVSCTAYFELKGKKEMPTVKDTQTMKND